MPNKLFVMKIIPLDLEHWSSHTADRSSQTIHTSVMDCSVTFIILHDIVTIFAPQKPYPCCKGRGFKGKGEG
jgi:hypothetical protein